MAADFYEPTEAEIAAACLAIRSTWSDCERIKRRMAEPRPVDTPPMVRRLAEYHCAERLEEQRAG